MVKIGKPKKIKTISKRRKIIEETMINYNYLLKNLPGITVIMIDVGRNDDWFIEAQQSVLNQIYPIKLINKEKNKWKTQIELKIVNNREKKFTIGECWNELIRQATFDYIYILDDDDKIVPELLFNLMIFFQTLKLDEKNKDIIGVSSSVTLMEIKDGTTYHKYGNYYTSGLIEKKWLLKIPFRENVRKHIDLRWDDDITKAHKYVAVQPWNHGAIYRQHDNMVSGRNMDMKYADDELNKIVDIEVKIK